MANLTDDVLSAVFKGKSRAPQISKFIFGNINSVRSALERLEQRGEIVRTRRGEYSPLPSFSDQIEPEEVVGWYFSGLNYEKDLGLEIFGNYTVDEAEDVLREYARLNLLHYNDNFYGIAEIQWNGEELDEIIEVNL